MAISFDSYMKDMVQPMRDDLTRLGIQELRTPDEVVDTSLCRRYTLLVINSVCGCAAGQCRPGVAKALQNAVKAGSFVYSFCWSG